MGNRGSRPASESSSQDDDYTPSSPSNTSISSSGGSLFSSPMSTPKMRNLDPRSPSACIARTPLEMLLSNNAISITNNNTSKSLPSIYDAIVTDSPSLSISSDNMIINNTTTTPVMVLLDNDPRSPTIDFDRTPIIVNAIRKPLSTQIFNRNLLLLATNNNTPLKGGCSNNDKDDEKLSHHQIPPKLLESSPITINVSNKRKSFVGLLETNVDYTETDLDDAFLKNNNSFSQTKSLLLSPNKSLLEINDNQSCATTQDLSPDKNASVMPASLIVPLDGDNQEEPAHDLIDEISVVLKSPPDQIIVNKPLVSTKIINITANVKELDKKLSCLIYEDDATKKRVVNGEGKKMRCRDEGTRTPLGERNAIDTSRLLKGINKLKVSDKPRVKLDYAVSKIPVFKKNDGNKNRRVMVPNVQCENTPPRCVNNVGGVNKVKRSQWDGDNTLVI